MLSAVLSIASLLVALAFDGGSQAANDACNLFRLGKQALVVRFSQMPNVEGYVQQRANFGARRFGDGEELVKLGRSCPFKALCNI